MKDKNQTPVTPEQVIMTPEDKYLYEYANSKEADPPRRNIQDVVELRTGIEMEVKPYIQKGPEYAYAWLDKANLSGPSAPGEKWQIVNRHNHGHINTKFFQQGIIQYKNQNVLAYCWREEVELDEKIITDAYNAKTEKITRTEENAVSGGVNRIDLKAAGNVVDGGLIDNFVDQAKYPPAQDDF